MASVKQHRYIVWTYVLPLMTYCLPMFIGQTQQIKEWFKVTINKLYRIMYDGDTYLTRSETIYNQIKMPSPMQLIAQNSMMFIHRVITNGRPKQVFKEMEFPASNIRNNAPRLVVAAKSKHFERTMLFESIRVYSNLSPLVRELLMKHFSKHIKLWKISLEPNPQ